ncbi:DUF4007 family protein [Prolixibacteraceae bacterium JC049]|nr:DUF4007 family protein [Prolixibacteraceae bacterium JC049]
MSYLYWRLFTSRKTMTKYIFSGHETFYCRHYWLKKGFDFLNNNNNFNDNDAVTKLGVGKNMVTSIRFWLRAFNITQNEGKNYEDITDFGNFLFGDKGIDPYLEDINSLWLLHYHLVKKEFSSIYTLFFNNIKNGDREFSDSKIKSQLIYRIEKESKELPSEKTLANDIKVFRANYVQPRKSINIEDDFIGLLQELHLFEKHENNKIVVQNAERESISAELFMYTILDRFNSRNSIAVEEILTEKNSPGIIFCMNENGVLKKLNEIVEKYPEVRLTEDAGIRELQLTKTMNKIKTLENYYA